MGVKKKSKKEKLTGTKEVVKFKQTLAFESLKVNILLSSLNLGTSVSSRHYTYDIEPGFAGR